MPKTVRVGVSFADDRVEFVETEFAGLERAKLRQKADRGVALEGKGLLCKRSEARKLAEENAEEARKDNAAFAALEAAKRPKIHE